MSETFKQANNRYKRERLNVAKKIQKAIKYAEKKDFGDIAKVLDHINEKFKEDGQGIDEIMICLDCCD